MAEANFRPTPGPPFRWESDATRSDRAATQIVVGAAVARQPSGQFLVGVCATGRVDLGDVVGILREFDDQPIGRAYIDRFAIAVVGLAILLARAFQALLQLLVSLRLRLARDVVVAANLGRLFGLGHLVKLG